jgi:hypothetical protein
MSPVSLSEITSSVNTKRANQSSPIRLPRVLPGRSTPTALLLIRTGSRQLSCDRLNRGGCGDLASACNLAWAMRKRCIFCDKLTANRPRDRFCWAVFCAEQCFASYAEWFSEWVAQGRMAQGLPPKLDDPVILARIALITGLDGK